MRHLIAFAGLALAAGVAGADHLTADGKLKSQLEITDVQGGFAGFTGTKITVEPDGSWKVSQVFNRKDTEKKSGKFNARQLKQVAELLDRFGFDALPAKSGGPSKVNPHAVTVRF